MEVIKELPEVFEEFAEQRKNSFLAIEAIKRIMGNPGKVGAYCTYFQRKLRNGYGSSDSWIMFHIR